MVRLVPVRRCCGMATRREAGRGSPPRAEKEHPAGGWPGEVFSACWQAINGFHYLNGRTRCDLWRIDCLDQPDNTAPWRSMQANCDRRREIPISRVAVRRSGRRWMEVRAGGWWAGGGRGILVSSF